MATPRFIRNLSRNEAARFIVCRLARSLVRIVYATGRWRAVGIEHPQRLWQEGKPAIVCFWHGRLMMLPYAWQAETPFHMLQSPHADGRLMACIINGLGIKTLWGSSSRGGTEALRRMVSVLRQGGTIGITPDGPRGPRMRASEGAIALARLTGAPLLPLAFGSSTRRLLRTWDRLAVALPFGRGVFVWGEPIFVARDADGDALERVRLQLEAALNTVTDEADRLTGQPCVEPAPLTTEMSGQAVGAHS